MAGGNTLNLVLKRIQGHFVKMPPLNKINLKNEKKKKKKTGSLYKTKTANLKLNQFLKTYKISFIN